MNRAEILREVLKNVITPDDVPIIRRQMDQYLRQFRPNRFEQLKGIFDQYGTGSPAPYSQHLTQVLDGYTSAMHTFWPDLRTSYLRLKPVVPDEAREAMGEHTKYNYTSPKVVAHELTHAIQHNPENLGIFFQKNQKLSKYDPNDIFWLLDREGYIDSLSQRLQGQYLGNSKELVAEAIAQRMKGTDLKDFFRKPIVEDAAEHWYKTFRNLALPIGAAGAFGLGSGLLDPQEAEAFQVSKAQPITQAVKNLQQKPFSLSSAAEALKGKFIQGLEIMDVVTKGKGDERFVLLKNPETEQVFQWQLDKEAVSTLAAMKGYETYMKRFKGLGSKDPLGKFEMAQKSADTRIEKGLTGTLKDVQPWTEAYLSKTHALSPLGESNLEEMPDLVYIRWKGQTMHFPRWYADFLEYEKKKPTNRYIARELQDFQVLTTEPKYYKNFAMSKGAFDPGKRYQYAILENGQFKFEEGTGEELNYWFSEKGMKKQKQEGFQIMTLSEIEDYISKLGGVA